MRLLVSHTAPLAALALALAGCGGDDPTPAVISSFTASAEQIDAGQVVTLTWSVQDADGGVTITDDQGGTVVEGGPASGTADSMPLDLDTTFTLSVAGTDGVEKTAEVSVQVTGISIIRFEADPDTIGRGESAALSWQLGGSPPSEVVVVIAGQGPVSDPTTERNGSIRVTPVETTTYTLRAQAGGVQDEATVTVTVTSMPPVIDRFGAFANVGGQEQEVTAIAGGSTAFVRWATSNANLVRLLQDGTVIRDWSTRQVSSGSFTSDPVEGEMVTLTLEAANAPEPVPNPLPDDFQPNPADVASRDLVLTTQPSPSIDTLTVTPSEFAGVSETITVEWATSNAETIGLELGANPAPGFSGEPSGTYTFDTDAAIAVVLTVRNQVGIAQDSRQVSLGFDDPEPNDATAEAIPLDGSGTEVRGTLSTATDVDFYVLTVPEGASVFARVEDAGEPTCIQMQPELTLYDGSGTELGTRSTDRAGTECAEIIPPEYAGFAGSLSAGMYFLRVSGAPTGAARTYRLVAQVVELGAPLANVTVSRVGAPEWDVTDFFQGTTEVGTADPFPELAQFIAGMFGSRHTVATPNSVYALSRPSAAAPSDFSQEMRQMAAFLGIQNSTQFPVSAFQGINGVVTGLTIVPTGTSTGTSRDFPGGNAPVIPNGILPIEVVVELYVDGELLGTLNGDLDITGDPAADGLSHISAIIGLSEAVLGGALDYPATVQYKFILRDQNENATGYDVEIPFTLNP